MLYWIDHVWSSKECVCCVCDPSEHIDSPSICLFVFCMSDIISSFRSFRAGSHVFALLMLFLCVILHTMSSGKNATAMQLALWYGLLVCHQYDVCENYVGSVCILVGMVV